MKIDAQPDPDVLVIGGGPTGLTLAAELALGGVSVTVVERQQTPSGQSRGGGISARTCEVLAMRGLLDATAGRSLTREGAGGHFAGLPVPLDARPWRTRHPDGLLIPQDRIEQILEARARELGATVLRGTELTGLTTGDGVTATLAGPDGATVLRSSYLVACDGAHSSVRKLTGIPFPGRAGTMAAVSADIELAAASESVPRTLGHISGLTRQVGGVWMLLHPLGDATDPATPYRLVFAGPEQATLPREAPVTAAEVAAALTAVHGTETRLGRLRWGSRFSDACRQLTDYRHGPVLFAGDAAHIHTPVGGQGLNLGVQDAMNLGWKLAAQVRGDAPDGLLDSYHAERHPVAARVLAGTRAQSLVMSPPPDADDVRALRDIMIDLARLPDANRYLAGMMSGLDLRYDLGDPDAADDPLVGRRIVDLSLVTADGPTTVSTLLRSGHGLLLELGPPSALPPHVHPRVDAVVARAVDSPVGSTLGAGPGIDRVLVRPDGYVCWAGAGPDASPEAALRRWFGTAAVPLTPSGAGS
ncbi:FAD-dependent oxidoreductase [Pseudonocardia xinjiangensis]|uniref:FAD-dependent oxidoreductase n=1 Tax=Pseudonocardia xinjiangensis TaxID=75289 RepID=UPI003D8A8A88